MKHSSLGLYVTTALKVYLSFDETVENAAI
jgi:hypothetical protein